MTTYIAIILGGLGIMTYILNWIFKPNAKQDMDIAILKKDIVAINEDILDMKVNHLAHIERDVRELRDGQIRIETLLKK